MTSTPPEPNPSPQEAPSAIVRNLGMIKAAAIIMGVLIIVLTIVVIGTIASRLAGMSAPPADLTLAIPAGSEIRAASSNDSGMMLVVDTPASQQIWQLSADGKRVKTIIVVPE